MIFPYLPIFSHDFSHDFPSSTPVRMERKGAYYALVAAQESSEKADDAEDHQSLGKVKQLEATRKKGNSEATNMGS